MEDVVVMFSEHFVFEIRNVIELSAVGVEMGSSINFDTQFGIWHVEVAHTHRVFKVYFFLEFVS